MANAESLNQKSVRENVFIEDIQALVCEYISEHFPEHFRRHRHYVSTVIEATDDTLRGSDRGSQHLSVSAAQ